MTDDLSAQIYFCHNYDLPSLEIVTYCASLLKTNHGRVISGHE